LRVGPQGCLCTFCAFYSSQTQHGSYPPIPSPRGCLRTVPCTVSPRHLKAQLTIFFPLPRIIRPLFFFFDFTSMLTCLSFLFSGLDYPKFRFPVGFSPSQHKHLPCPEILFWLLFFHSPPPVSIFCRSRLGYFFYSP